MRAFRLCTVSWMWTLVPALLVGAAGCQTVAPRKVEGVYAPAVPPSGMPRELCKSVLPTYVIEPPDILTIDAFHIVPRPPYRLKTLDALRIRVERALPDAPVDGIYMVELGSVLKGGGNGNSGF